MKKMKVRITFTEPVLGTAPSNTEIYTDFIGSKAPDASTLDEEIAALGAEEVERKGMTVFPRNEKGEPILWDYQIKGFFKDACSILSKIGGKDEKGKKVAVNESSKMTAFKKTIDGLIFVHPRQIVLQHPGEIGICQRPLRAMTMQGERVALSSSEELPAGTWCDIEIVCMAGFHMPAVLEWLDYGALRGIGQWRNSGKGRFEWKEIQDESI